jgi:hypothetical protein
MNRNHSAERRIFFGFNVERQLKGLGPPVFIDRLAVDFVVVFRTAAHEISRA